MDGAQWILFSLTSSSYDSVWMVHSGYHPLKHRPLRQYYSLKHRVWMVHSGYHPLKHRPLRIVFGWCLDGAQWIQPS